MVYAKPLVEGVGRKRADGKGVCQRQESPVCLLGKLAHLRQKDAAGPAQKADEHACQAPQQGRKRPGCVCARLV